MDKCNCTLNVLCHIHDINSNRSLFCMEGQNRFLLPTFSSFFQFRCPTLFSTFFIGNFVTFFIFLPFFFVKYHWIILRISAKDVYYIYHSSEFFRRALTEICSIRHVISFHFSGEYGETQPWFSWTAHSTRYTSHVQYASN